MDCEQLLRDGFIIIREMARPRSSCSTSEKRSLPTAHTHLVRGVRQIIGVEKGDQFIRSVGSAWCKRLFIEVHPFRDGEFL